MQTQAEKALSQTTPAPGATVYRVQGGSSPDLSVPQTRDQIASLIQLRRSLGDQLDNLSDRRHALAMELQRSIPAARTGLEDRLRVLDQEIVQLETDLATTGQQLAAAPPNLVATTETRVPPYIHDARDSNFAKGTAVGGLSMLAASVLVLFFSRLRWKRSRVATPALGDESARRLERLENSMDAIALEIERVSENQRFVTKLLSESPALKSPAGGTVPQKEIVSR